MASVCVLSLSYLQIAADQKQKEDLFELLIKKNKCIMSI